MCVYVSMSRKSFYLIYAAFETLRGILTGWKNARSEHGTFLRSRRGRETRNGGRIFLPIVTTHVVVGVITTCNRRVGDLSLVRR